MDLFIGYSEKNKAIEIIIQFFCERVIIQNSKRQMNVKCVTVFAQSNILILMFLKLIP
ncbi:hypothetical protein ACVWYG_000587 [Pedobacter sp. UYEF25]